MGRKLMEGDVFEVKISETKKKLIQYIKKDELQLYSHVIRGYKEEFPVEENLFKIDTERLTIDFYTHTIINIGEKEFGWRKVCNRPLLDLPKTYLFFSYHNDTLQNRECWLIWGLDKNERFFYSKVLPNIGQELYEGSVLPPYLIMNKMRNGLFQYLYTNPNGAELAKIWL